MLMVLCGFGWFAEITELVIMSFVAPQIQKDFDLSPLHVSPSSLFLLSLFLLCFLAHSSSLLGKNVYLRDGSSVWSSWLDILCWDGYWRGLLGVHGGQVWSLDWIHLHHIDHLCLFSYVLSENFHSNSFPPKEK